MKPRFSIAVGFLGLALAAGSCREGGNLQLEPPANAVDKAVKVEVPIGLPPIPYPAGGSPMEASIELGRRLFYDKNLSLDGSVSCASCHNPRFGFSDNRPVGLGVGGRRGTRNSPSLFNVAYGKTFFRDGRVDTLDQQATGPLTDPQEMAQTPEALEKRLNDNSIYRSMFARAYGPGPITLAKTSRALAVFERLLLSGNSLFDKFAYLGNRKALTAEAVRGLEIFGGRGNCSICHQFGKEFALFTDGQFHNLGVGANERGELADLGRYRVTKSEEDKGAFKTPTLRSIALTRPYMHDGSLSSLSAVVEFYSQGGRPNPHLSKLIRPLNFTAQDKIDLLAFLESLTGEPVAQIGPPEGEQ